MATFLRRLVPEKLWRLIAIKQKHPGTALHNLPETVRHEVTAILTSAVNSAANGAGQNGHSNGTAASLHQGTASLLHDSYTERAAAWARHAHLSKDEQLREWEQVTDSWLAGLPADQQAFLKRLLRQNGQMVDAIEVSAKAIYHVFMEEGRGDIEFFARRIVETNSPAQLEHNKELIEGLAKMYGDQSATRVLPLISALIPTRARRNGRTPSPAPSSVLGLDVATGMEVCIAQQDRLQGLYCIGANGTGKSTLLTHLILSDICRGMGVCVIEPHNALVKAVIAGIPPHLLKKVILIDITDADLPVGLNLFECPPPKTITSIAAVANFLAHVFEKVWGAGTETPRLMMVLRALTRTLIDNSPHATFTEIPLLFSDDAVRAKLVENLTNSSIASFWEGYNRRTQRDKDELVASTLNKVLSFLDNEMIRHMVGQSRTTIDFRQVMDEGKILLVLLSPQFEEASRLLGSVLIGKLLMAAFSRADTPEEERRPFALYVDEFQRFASEDLAVFLAEARKFRIQSTIANQTLEQLDEANRAAALQAGHLVAFRVSGLDSKALAPSYDATPAMEVVGQEPIRASAADPLSHLVRHGSPEPVLAGFIAKYLMPLDALLRKVGHAIHPFQLGCTFANSYQVIEGHRLLNDCLAECMREGRSDVFIPPLALFVLGAAADDGITQIFADSLKHDIFGTIEFKGFYEDANRFGRAGFLANEQAVANLLKKHAKKRVWDDVFASRMVTPGPSFIAMLRSLRAAMEVLAERPILVDTGLYKDVLRPRTYSDTQAEIGNFLANQPNHQARAKLLSGEHVVKTLPPPDSLPEHEIQARIAAIKQQMRLLGITKPYREVEQEIRERQEKLRQRPHSDAPPPSSSTGRPPRRLRQKPPPPFT
jgi:Type IV secretion-system coupling protein DNA-binding domain